MVNSFVIAWHFLTAIPLSPSYHDPAPRDLARSMGWFPFIGLILGGCLAVSDLLLSIIFPHSIVNVLLIVMLVVLTGGLHVDGLADSIDGLAGGRTPADRLAIMRDARIGAMGATALMLALGLRYAGFMALPQCDRFALLICLPVAGRWAMVIGSLSVPYARREGGLAQPFLQQLSMREVIIATVLLLGVFLWGLGPVGAVIGSAAIAAVARAISALAYRVLGGITGDTLGATNEVAEIVFLITAPALAGLGSMRLIAP